MFRRIAPFLLGLVVLASPAGANPIPWIVQFYQAAVTAQQEGDNENYEAAIRAALDQEPSHPALHRHLARALAAQGDFAGALNMLELAARSGVDLGIATDPAFAALHDSTRFQAVLDTIDAHRAPIGNPTVAWTIPERGLMAEGIAVDPADGTLYVGSVLKRTITRIAPDGAMTTFADRKDGLYGVLGLRVDPGRNVLWACSAMFPGVEGETDDNRGHSALIAFDLDSGKRKQAYDVAPTPDGDRNLNDVTIAPNGDVFTGDTGIGAVFRVQGDADTLETFLGPGTMFGANGLDVTPDGALLFVSSWSVGIARVDLATREVVLLAHPEEIATLGVDGLYVRDGKLFVVQNYPGLDRVAELTLDPPMTGISAMRVLAAHSPLHEEPTTGVVLADRVLYIGNSQLDRLAPDGSHPDPAALQETRILSVPR